MVRGHWCCWILCVLISGCSTTVSTRAPAPAASPAEALKVPTILFDAGSTTLSLHARQQIQQLADALKKPERTNTKVVVTGYTDATGNAHANYRVGLERALAVAQELVFDGIARERLIVRSSGEQHPIAPNTYPDGRDNPEGRARNRRVELTIESGETVGSGAS